MTIDDLIRKELAYFHPMKIREAQATDETKKFWRTETIRERQRRIALEAFDLCEGKIKYGPFKGLLLNRNTWWGELDLGSQCFGLYEREILNIIEKITPDTYQTFIDIGAADGYYAIGILKSGKIKRAICYEQSPDGRFALKKNWEKNLKPGQLDIFGEANIETLRQLSAADLQNVLILIDVEGAEFDILNRETLHRFQDCEMIVEIHNWTVGFVEKYTRLLKEASEYFTIEIIGRVERPTMDISELRDFTDDNRLLLTSERRPCLMRFLRLLPKKRSTLP